MASRKSYGRAFPIREADIGSYRMTTPPRSRSYRANAMGVTTLSSVNGPGSYSARHASEGRSRAERIARARQLMQNRSRSMHSNAHRARFVRRMKSNAGTRPNARTRTGPRSRRGAARGSASASRRRSGRRLAAYRAAMRRGGGTRRAARAALRSVPFTTGERRKGRSFKGVRQRNYRRNDAGAPAYAGKTQLGLGPAYEGKTKVMRKTKAQRRSERSAARKAKRSAATAKRKTRRAAASAKRKVVRAQRSERRKARTTAKRAKYKAGAEKRKARKVAKRTRAQRKKIRRTYRRASVGGRKSYLYRGGKKKGRGKKARRGLRKIPAWVTAGALSAKDYKSGKYDKARARIASRRKAAAARIEKSGSAFVPNRRNARLRRLAVYRAAKKKIGKRKAARLAVREVPFTATEVARGSTFVGVKSGEPMAARKRRKKARKTTKARRRRSRKGTRRSTKARRRRKGTRRRSRRRAKRRTTRRRRRRSRAAAPRRRRRRKASTKARRRRSRKGGRRTARRRVRRARRNYRRNGFMADFQVLLMKGTLVLGGFVLHKALTTALCRMTDRLFAPAAAPAAGLGQLGAMAAWQRPICGGLVAAAGVLGLSFAPVKPETRQLLGVGMVVSFVQNLLSTALTRFNQPELASYLAGTESMAYRLRGLGAQRSIMPGYTPVMGMGQSFMQAAAGMGRLGAVGEYFASNAVRGVGNYEQAGPLALMPSMSAMGQLPIDDGIRPDSDLDRVLDLAESAAGLGQGQPRFTQAAAGMGRLRGLGRRGARGVGEYFTAVPSNGGFAEAVVPRQDQWIPNGPVWAPTMPADAAFESSTVAAGILAGAGGNGSLSG